MSISIGKNRSLYSIKEVKGQLVEIENETYYQIANVDEMRPFFVSLVSHSDHWMFLSSNGGITAGRKNSNYALFPYYTDDKISRLSETTGNKSIFLVDKDEDTFLWQPFSSMYSGIYQTQNNLYKNACGNKIIFEEINHDLKLTFRYQWSTSEKYGFVKKSMLINHDEAIVKVQVLDGIQNVMPYGVPSDLQNGTSNLVDAYKRTQLEPETGIGIFALSAIIVDKAEPSEALKANLTWSLGADNPTYLLSTLQVEDFKKGLLVEQETDVKAEKGAYLIVFDTNINTQKYKEWMIVAEVNQSVTELNKTKHQLKTVSDLAAKVNQDIEDGTLKLTKLIGNADGLQLSADKLRDMRHYSNTMFNIMRGGIFDDAYQIEKADFKKYIKNANKLVFNESKDVLVKLPEKFSLFQLKATIKNVNNVDFIRLSTEYLPLKFSRRHGDPTRPWNKFSINLRNEQDGSKILDYQGNWRDIFQNWEALVHTYPKFIEGMIYKFLNASTFDGYNPYRVTKDGFDWETIEPDDPWSYIGYWGDHQIIYLLKFLEFIESHNPGRLKTLFNQDIFVYANVPYKIKSYSDIVENPKDTIVFDNDLDEQIREKRAKLGADGALIHNKNQKIHHITFVEKILATTLAKLSNFIPEAGIWMNTQRPEWNDANNALVGNGVSMVTLYYLRRFLYFFKTIFADVDNQNLLISSELFTFFSQISEVLASHKNLLSGSINDVNRKKISDALGEAGSNYRIKIYQKAFSGQKEAITVHQLKNFIDISLAYLEHSIDANKRTDNLYHAYNLMTINNDGSVSISYLDEMLEGQVAVLSSGYLSAEENLKLLDALKQSRLFRHDQYSYLLYPNKALPLFIDKNNVDETIVAKSNLLKEMVKDGNTQIIEQDIFGQYHFNGNFKNVNDLNRVLRQFTYTKYAQWAENEEDLLQAAFEQVFNHKAFTGRSGTFYGYEGLGSIYWHMVSKLQLAVQEVCLQAINNNKSVETIGHLLEHYYEINEGIGVHKSPKLYGAFPSDPYSHTPANKGAQQPGMTGQVKEDILSRFGELGVVVKDGKLSFNPTMLKREEFLNQLIAFNYVDVEGNFKQLMLDKATLGFTFCQVPVIYKISNKKSLTVIKKDDSSVMFNHLTIEDDLSDEIFNRTGVVKQITVELQAKMLK